MKKITLLLIALIATFKLNATHITGGQISSRCLGGLTHEITLTLFRDIQGVSMAPQIISYSANTLTYNSFRTVAPGPPIPFNTTTEMYLFVDTVTFPYLDSYTISNSNCCRAATITNINNPASTVLYLDLIVSISASCNSTPLLPVNPYNPISVSIPFIYAMTAIDPDGDSLSYSLVPPSDNASSPVSGFILPSNMTISNNGILNWTPTFPGTYSICVKVDEYRNGNLIGYVRREMQINVGTFNSINELEINKNSEYKNFYDLLGRKVNSNYNGFRIYE